MEQNALGRESVCECVWQKERKKDALFDVWDMGKRLLWIFIFSFFCFPLQMLESQVEVRQKEVEELRTQAQALSQEGKGSDEVDGLRCSVEKKFHKLQDPLKERRGNLMASREVHQFNRDVEDEIVSRLAGLNQLRLNSW